MNERIKQLAEQAGGGLSCIAEPLEHPWKFSESELEKFAKLLVQTCATLLPSDMTHGPDGSPLSQVFKEHFGVE